MAGRRRTDLEVEAERRNAEQLARLGAQVRAARRVRLLTQAALGEKAGVSRASVSRLELGHGGGLTLDAWQRITLAAARPLVVSLQQPIGTEPPREPGLVWASVDGTRLFAWRRRPGP